MSNLDSKTLPALPAQEVTQDRFVEDIAVAAIDVLGMNQLMVEDGDCGRAIEAFQLFVLNAAGLASTGRELVHYGDVVYIFADEALPVAQQAARLQVVSAQLLALAMAVPPERTTLRLRIGIARGNLHVRQVDCLDSTYELMMGTAMTRALGLERAQDWVGCAVERDLVTADDALVRPDFAVPWKSGTTQDAVAVDWVAPAVAHCGADTVGRWAEGLETANGTEPGTQRKLSHTARFVRAMLARG